MEYAFAADKERFGVPTLTGLIKIGGSGPVGKLLSTKNAIARKSVAEFAAALKKSKKTSAGYAALSPSCQREYFEWIAKGKQRNWKYQQKI